MALDVAAAPSPFAPAIARPALASRTSTGPEPNATLIEREDLTPTIARLRIRVDGSAATFRAGQYFAIGLAVDGRFVQRPYSAASAPAVTHDLEFLVRLVPGGALTPGLWRLGPGDRVRIGPPKGLFTLDHDDARRHLLLSTGTGIAPLRSMLASLVAPSASRGGSLPSHPPIVVHGVASVPELAYRDELERLARGGRVVYVPAISRPNHPANDGWTGRTGRLDSLVGAVADSAGIDPSTTVAYLCGNPAMIAAVEPRLAALGIPTGAIRSEQYWTTPR